MKSGYIISIIAILVAGVAGADNNIVSKAYVDNMTQEKIITSGTGGNILIYDGVDSNTGQTQFDEVGTYDGSATYDANNDAELLALAGVVADFATAVENTTIPDTKLVCANSPECSLWTKPTPGSVKSLVESGTFSPLTTAAPQCLIVGTECTEDSDCCSNICDNSFKTPVCASCKSDGATCSLDSDCCNYCNNGSKPPTCASCKSIGASCSLGAECCSGQCLLNSCSSAQACKANGQSCSKNSECCSNFCNFGTCRRKIAVIE